MRRYAILGSGFGLYGYLPAAAGLTVLPVVTLDRYRPVFERRGDIAAYLHRVEFVEDVDACAAAADTLIVAQRPADQEALIPRLLARPSALRSLVLEKPLAPAPGHASILLQRLYGSQLSLRIGFTFAQTPWAARIAELLARGVVLDLDLQWRFRAHHFQHQLHNWKRDTACGGGALRYFGIQFFGLLASLGSWSADACERRENPIGEDAAVTAWFKSDDGHGAKVSCDSDFPGDARFTIDVRERSSGTLLLNMDLTDPFAESPDGEDRRIGLLRGILSSLDLDDSSYWRAYRQSIELWRQCEALSGRMEGPA